jgi:outer membrane lipoprotein-sorting protein
MNLTRRALTMALAALPLPALAAPPAATPLSAEDRALVSTATAYLQNLAEAKGGFVQTDARGRSTQGTLYLKRPGKARFAYDAPSGMLVVSDGNFVSIQDKRLNTFERYPLMSTPLSLFLARQIRLDRGVKVSRVTRLADGFSITAADAKKPADGNITLTFANRPMRLLGWTVTDGQGQATRVRLTALEATSGLSPALFELKDPRPANPGRARM